MKTESEAFGSMAALGSQSTGPTDTPGHPQRHEGLHMAAMLCTVCFLLRYSLPQHSLMPRNGRKT